MNSGVRRSLHGRARRAGQRIRVFCALVVEPIRWLSSRLPSFEVSNPLIRSRAPIQARPDPSCTLRAALQGLFAISRECEVDPV